MTRWVVIATLSLTINGVGWGVFGRFLSQGTAPRPRGPVELSLVPPPAPPVRAAAPMPLPPPAVTPPRECLPAPRPQPRIASPRVRPPARPVTPPRPVPAREAPAPLPPTATAALPRTTGGTHPPAPADQEGASGDPVIGRAPSAPRPPAPRPPAPRAAPDVGALRARIHAAIQRHRHYPRLARRRGLEGTVVLFFRVTRAGALAEARVLRSAGALLDQAALDALRRAVPLPYTPEAVRVPVVFALED